MSIYQSDKPHIIRAQIFDRDAHQRNETIVNILYHIAENNADWFTVRQLRRDVNLRLVAKSTLYRALEHLVMLGVLSVCRDHWGNVYVPCWRKPAVAVILNEYKFY